MPCVYIGYCCRCCWSVVEVVPFVVVTETNQKCVELLLCTLHEMTNRIYSVIWYTASTLVDWVVEKSEWKSNACVCGALAHCSAIEVAIAIVQTYRHDHLCVCAILWCSVVQFVQEQWTNNEQGNFYASIEWEKKSISCWFTAEMQCLVVSSNNISLNCTSFSLNSKLVAKWQIARMNHTRVVSDLWWRRIISHHRKSLVRSHRRATHSHFDLS